MAGSPDKRLRRAARRKEASGTSPAALYAVLDLCDASFDAWLVSYMTLAFSCALPFCGASQLYAATRRVVVVRFGPLAATHAALCSFVAPQHQ